MLQLIRDVMSKGKAAGLNVIRAWATASSQPYALQPSNGTYSEAMFRGLDYALELARQQDLKVSCAAVRGLYADVFIASIAMQHILRDSINSA